MKELVSSLRNVDMSKQVLLFHSMDNGVFFSIDRNGGSSLPRKISNAYHIPGKLVVASGYALEMMAEQMATIAKETKPGLVVVITPRTCRVKLLKAVWNLKRETYHREGRGPVDKKPRFPAPPLRVGGEDAGGGGGRGGTGGRGGAHFQLVRPELTRPLASGFEK